MMEEVNLYLVEKPSILRSGARMPVSEPCRCSDALLGSCLAFGVALANGKLQTLNCYRMSRLPTQTSKREQLPHPWNVGLDTP